MVASQWPHLHSSGVATSSRVDSVVHCIVVVVDFSRVNPLHDIADLAMWHIGVVVVAHQGITAISPAYIMMEYAIALTIHLF